MANEIAVDSDESFPGWEEFFGPPTELMPQLLHILDEKMYSHKSAINDVIIPTSLDKRMSFGHLYNIIAAHDNDADDEDNEDIKNESSTTITVINNNVRPGKNERLNDMDDSLAPFRCNNKRCRNVGRPLSSSSIASSTSSSGCSNHGNTSTVNPYLASVESLADTCVSSQGSGDSGVMTVSDTSSRINGISTCQTDNHHSQRYSDYCPRYCDPQRNPVERVLLEIVDTEAFYVEHLRQVIQGYLTFWRNEPAPLFSELELNDLFSNIEDIYEFNSKFLCSLENCGLDPIAVANTFIEHNSGFKVYTQYCTNYPRTISTFTEMMRHDVLARAFRERQAALGHALPLGSFLLKPVQRILKYHLLLENLSKEFDAGGSSPSSLSSNELPSSTTSNIPLSKSSESEEISIIRKKSIESALEAMTGIAKHINAMKRKHEHAVRVQEIQSLLYGWPGPDLTTSGELIAEGTFRMRGAKAPRHVFLFEQMFLLTKKREDGVLVYKAHVMCSNLTLMESIPGEPLCFHVIPFDNSQCQFKLQARSLEQKREWTLQIKRVILENYNAVIPSHARQLVLQIGQNKYDDDDTPRKYRKSDRRRSEAGLRQKLRKSRKSDVETNNNSPLLSRKNQSSESISLFGIMNENLIRGSEIRGSKIKDRFTNWRRKSEPGFQSYVNLNFSDNNSSKQQSKNSSTVAITNNSRNLESLPRNESKETLEDSQVLKETKDIQDSNNDNQSEQSKEATVEEIVSHILKQNQEFQKIIDKQRVSIFKAHRKHSNRFNHNNQKKKSNPILDTTDDDYDDNDETDNENLNNSSFESDNNKNRKHFIRANNAYNQRSFRVQYDSFRNADNDDPLALSAKSSSTPRNQEYKRSTSENLKKPNILTESRLIRNALCLRDDNTDNNDNSTVWENHDCCINQGESPTTPSVWLNKLCENLPESPKKCDSLPRSFQIGNIPVMTNNGKQRFLQRDGKLMSERPFTIASDKPAEINLEDMERYRSNCQSPGSTLTSFCSFEDSYLTDADSSSNISGLPSVAAHQTHYHHPEHKIYRPSAASSIKGVFFKASNKLKNSLSAETLEFGIDAYSKVFSRTKKNDDILYQHKQGSSSLGARIAQPDYADPSILFVNNNHKNFIEEDELSDIEQGEKIEGFYEKSFEIIENYVDGEEAFRDSAIFSDGDDTRPKTPLTESSTENIQKLKPAITKKPENLKFKRKIVKCVSINNDCKNNLEEINKNINSDEKIDISEEEKQSGWVKKMIEQIQAKSET